LPLLPTYLPHPPPTHPPHPTHPQACREELAREPSTLFVSSAYHIGKEKAIFSTAEALGIKVG